MRTLRKARVLSSKILALRARYGCGGRKNCAVKNYEIVCQEESYLR